MEYQKIIQIFCDYFKIHKKNIDFKVALEKEFGIIPELILGSSACSNVYKIQSFFNKLYLKDIRKIIELAEYKAIDIMFMKGMFWAVDLYPNYNYRLSCDLDILTLEENLQCLDEILREVGYSCEIYMDSLVERSRKYHIRYIKNIFNFGELLIEVHTNVFNPAKFYRGYTKWVMKSRETVNLLGVHAQIENAQDRIIHSCLHFCCHLIEMYDNRLLNLKSTLKWKSLIDMALLINKYGININYLLDVVKNFQCGQDIYLPLKIVNSIIPGIVSNEVFYKLEELGLNSEILTNSLYLDGINEYFGFSNSKHKLLDIVNMNYDHVIILSRQYQKLFSYCSEKFIVSTYIKINFKSVLILMNCKNLKIDNSIISVHYCIINRETQDLSLEKIKCEFNQDTSKTPIITMPYNTNYEKNIQAKVKQKKNKLQCLFTIPIEALNKIIKIAPNQTISLSFILEGDEICLSGNSWNDFETMRHFKIDTF